jgi:hypothetical protein
VTSSSIRVREITTGLLSEACAVGFAESLGCVSGKVVLLVAGGSYEEVSLTFRIVRMVGSPFGQFGPSLSNHPMNASLVQPPDTHH